MNGSYQFDPDAYGDPPKSKLGGVRPFVLLLMMIVGVFVYLQLRAMRDRTARERLNQVNPSVERPAESPQLNRNLPDANRTTAQQGD